MLARISVPESLYVGIQSCPHVAELPTGYMTPFGTDKAFEKRKRTITHRLGTSMAISRTLGAFVIKNEPMQGFAMHTSALRYGRADYWSIVDPRGFAVPVPTENICHLLNTCTIDRGEIVGQCLYGRSGQSMILLPQSSPEFQEAVTYTRLQGMRVSIRQVAVGNTVYLRNGLKAKYLGYLYPITYNLHGFKYFTTRRHHFQVVDADYDSLHLAKTTQISEIIDDATISPSEVQTIIARVQEDARFRSNHRAQVPYAYFTSTAEYGEERITLELEETNRYTVRDAAKNGNVFIAIAKDADTYWQIDTYGFGRDPQRSLVDGRRINVTALLKTGAVIDWRGGFKRETFDLNKVSLFYVKATIANPITGSNYSLLLR